MSREEGALGDPWSDLFGRTFTTGPLPGSYRSTADIADKIRRAAGGRIPLTPTFHVDNLILSSLSQAIDPAATCRGTFVRYWLV